MSEDQAITSSAALASKFSNLQNYVYWSGTEWEPDKDAAWVFNTGYGIQGGIYKPGELYAMALRYGDVVAAPVPEPDSVMLVALGMGLIGWLARRRG